MRTPRETAALPKLRGAALLAAALLASACTTSGTSRPVAKEVRDAAGFTLTQELQVGSDVRRDFERALQALAQEEYEKGIPLLVQVTEAAPYVTIAHIDLGIAYERTDDLEHARASLEAALALDPHHPVALNELGIVYRRMGRFQDARRSYEAALARYPDFHFARRNLAILCDLYLSDVSCALENYQRYAKAVPDDEAVTIWIADLRTRAGK